jgi:drug/metabolite transporter (DMT)-like permease
MRRMNMDAAVAWPLLMLSAALLFTVLNLLVKLMGPAYTAWHIGFIRFAGGLIVLVVIFGRHHNPYRGNNLRLLIIRGFTGSVTFLCLVSAIRMLPVSTALVIFYSFPAFSAVFSFLIYGERIRKPEAACILVVMLGIGILFDFRLAGNLLGQAIALLGGCFAGLTVTLIRALRQNNGPVVIYLYFCTIGTLVTLPKFILNPILPATLTEWAMIAGIVLVSVTAQLLMNQGFFFCKGWEGGLYMTSEVIFTALVGIVFLSDPTSRQFWSGGFLILGSAVALNRINASAFQAEVSNKA